MKRSLFFFLGLCLMGFIACNKDDIYPDNQPTFSTSTIEAVTDVILDANGNQPTGDATPIFENRKNNPVIKPDGTQMTLGDFKSVKGNLKMTCDESGNKVELNMENLIPNGVYSIWILVFESPGFEPTFAHEIAEGVTGKNDGSQSQMTADQNGKANYMALTPHDDLSVFGSLNNCALEEFEVHIVGAYHIDGQTHGKGLGPDGTYTEHFAFIYKSEN